MSELAWHSEATLNAILAECRNENWDGEGALPITPRTIDAAVVVLQALGSLLPPDTRQPLLLPEHDGDIDISWNVDAGRVFGASIGEHGCLNYAAQLGSGRSRHGVIAIDVSDPAAVSAALAEIEAIVREVLK